MEKRNCSPMFYFWILSATPNDYIYVYERKDNMDKKERPALPNKAFDMEYSTMWGREVKFLYEKGIKYSFVKKTKEYGVSQFKYKKTPALFKALVEFYTQVENEREMRKAEEEMRNGIPVKSPEDLVAAMHKLGIKIVVKDGEPIFVAEQDDTI